MVDYDLTIQSEPTGIEMSVKALFFSQWIVTNKTLTYADGTVIDVIAPDVCGEPKGTTEKGFKFIKWENDSIDRKRSVTLTADITIIAYYEKQDYYPVRHYDKRDAKFSAKVDEEVYAMRTTALKPMMVEQQEVTSAQQVHMEKLVGDYLNKQSLYGIKIHHYRNFSNELFRLKRLFKNEVLNKEASLKAEKWKTRGLEQTHLENIAKLYGITLTFT